MKTPRDSALTPLEAALLSRARSVAHQWADQDGIGAYAMDQLVDAVRAYEAAYELTSRPIPPFAPLARDPLDWQPGLKLAGADGRVKMTVVVEPEGAERFARIEVFSPQDSAREDYARLGFDDVRQLVEWGTEWLTQSRWVDPCQECRGCGHMSRDLIRLPPTPPADCARCGGSGREPALAVDRH